MLRLKYKSVENGKSVVARDARVPYNGHGRQIAGGDLVSTRVAKP
ncbi:MAG TPA: hypothetical protein VGB36_15335 [Gammaproteobacteria bacterium]